MMQGKVALEEHVVLPSLSAVGSAADSNDPDYYADVRLRLVDADLRLEGMDRSGIQTMAAHPRRLAGFAAVAVQDPLAAGAELDGAVRQLGFRGALVNGFSNVGDAETAQYLDEPSVWEFWARVSTAGAFRSTALLDSLLEVGADRLLFSVDYAYENMQEQSEWFETVPINDGDRRKIGSENAKRLPRL